MPRRVSSGRGERSGAPPVPPPVLDVLRVTTAVRAGDAAAFGEFYEAWFDRACAIAQAITRGDEAFCLDVVQDAMLRMIRSMRPMESEERLARWVARVVHTTAIDRLRREARRTRREARACELRPRGFAVPEDQELIERVQWLEAALPGVSDEERVLLSERFGNEKTLEAAGAAVGLSGNAAHSRIRRALGRLRALAGKRFS
ncbi:MAG TPA: sigma-70 family RNA polymerase sigma factor [Planctomycetota bacterium]|nr:sigma-70 family RNA polymerase sigma factor [Planctomycetota bacterium]